VDAGLGWLAVLIALNAALAAFYYLRVIVYMYMRDGEEDPAPLDRHPLGTTALALSIIGVMLLGIFPEPILTLLRDSAAALF
jgi:NADH-quinone oxidoreductase subunit N